MNRDYPFVQTAGDAVDETAGQPRVRLLRNGRLDRAGRIVRTPAWGAGWYQDERDIAISSDKLCVTGAQLGKGFMVWEQSTGVSETAYPTLPFKTAVLGGGGRWQRNMDELDALVPIEAPVSKTILSQPGQPAYHGQIVATERTDTWAVVAQTTDIPGGYIYYVRARLFTVQNGVQYSRDLGVIDSLGGGVFWPKSIGSYFLYLDPSAAELYILSVSSAGVITTHKTLSVTGATGRFDACYDATTGTIAIVRSDGYSTVVTIATWADTGWTDRSTVFTSYTPIAQTYAIQVVGDTVWIACACNPSGYAYYIMSWEYPGWSTVQTATLVSSAVHSSGPAPTLSKGVAVAGTGGDKVWITGQIITRASVTLRGSLLVQSWTSDLTLGSGCNRTLTDAWAVSEVLDEGYAGAWLVVGTIREYLRQAWLVWLDRTHGTATGYTSAMRVRGAARLWNGRLASPATRDRPAQLVHASLGESQLGLRRGLLWCGPVIVDGDASWASASVLSGIAVASAAGAGAASVDWSWETDDADYWPPELCHPATAQGGLVLSAGAPLAFGQAAESAGMYDQPCAPTLADAGSGSSLSSGDYRYVVVRRRVDSLGRLHRSPVSEPTTLSKANTNDITVTLRGDPHYPGAQRDRWDVYRTEVGPGSVYYRVTSDHGIACVNWQDANVTITDAIADVDLVTNEVLYTMGTLSEDGTTSLLAGRLETWGPPGCRYIWGGSTRMIAGGLEEETEVRWSNLYRPGEAPGWPEHNGFRSQLPEPIRAVAALDDTWIVWTTASCYYVTGAGPDALGNGEFDAPRKLAGAPACLTQRSLLETPAGIYWQGPDLQVYLLQRGTLQVAQVSAEWSERIASTHGFDGDVYGANQCAIAGACYDAEEDLCYFARRALTTAAATAGLGGTVLYDPVLGSWSVECDTGELAHWCGAYSYQDQYHPVVCTYLLNYGGGWAVWLSPLTQYSGAARYTSIDPDYPHTLGIQTGNVTPWDSGGQGVVRRIGVLASTERGRSQAATAWASVTVQTRWDGDQTTQSGETYTITPGGSQDNDGSWLYEVAPARMRCSELSLIIQDAAAGAETWWHRLVVDADPARGVRLRHRAGNARA